MKRKGPKPGTKPSAERSKAQSPYKPTRSPTAVSKGAPNIDAVEQPWLVALKAAEHATPEQHAAAAAALAKRDPWDEVRR